MRNKSCVFIILLSFLSTLTLLSQESDSPYLFTRIGTHTVNEINVGYGFMTKGERKIELLFGVDFGSRIWDQQCGPLGLYGTERFRVRTALRGINLRASLFDKGDKNIGAITVMTRIALGNNVRIDPSCNGGPSPSRTYNQYIVFDTGLMYGFKILPKRKISFVFSPGYLFRLHFRDLKETNHPGITDEIAARTGIKLYPVFDFAIQINIKTFYKK